MTYHVMLCHVISYHITYKIIVHITSCHVTSCHAISYHNNIISHPSSIINHEASGYQIPCRSLGRMPPCQVRKALSYAPRKKRSLWVLNVTVAKLQMVFRSTRSHQPSTDWISCHNGKCLKALVFTGPFVSRCHWGPQPWLLGFSKFLEQVARSQ